MPGRSDTLMSQAASAPDAVIIAQSVDVEDCPPATVLLSAARSPPRALSQLRVVEDRYRNIDVFPAHEAKATVFIRASVASRIARLTRATPRIRPAA